MTKLYLVRYEQMQDGFSVGTQRLMNPSQAKERASAGVVVIINHPAFPAPTAKEFAGLPPEIPAPRKQRQRD